MAYQQNKSLSHEAESLTKYIASDALNGYIAGVCYNRLMYFDGSAFARIAAAKLMKTLISNG